MKLNNPLLKGTFLLTLAGLISRVIGFFYRIFLSHTIGAEGIGVYQMVFPLFALCFSITAAGLQTSISKHIAGAPHHKSEYLGSGCLLSLLFSVVCTFLLYHYSDFFAVSVLKEARTAPLIRVLALSVPFEAIHSCVNGYCLGLKKAALPAVTQLVEQSVRVCSVMLIYSTLIHRGYQPSLLVAVLGIVFGEFASMSVSSICVWFQMSQEHTFLHVGALYCKKLLSMSLPLTATRVTLNFLSSIEAICIPGQLQSYGLSRSDALSCYGILTGMALPLILFPSAITNSLSVMMVPAISATVTHDGVKKVDSYIKKSSTACALLGLCCTFLFLMLGRFLGRFLFHNEDAGSYILILSLLCPFLYVNSTLSSILHGLGKTSLTFTFSVLALSLRLLFVFFVIPRIGISGYFAGLLASQICHTVMLVFAMRRLKER